MKIGNIKKLLQLPFKFIVFSAVLFISFEAQAENWIEMFQGAYLNSDYIFVDRATGFVIAEIYRESDQGRDIDLMAVDCDNWYVYVLSQNPGAGDREIYPYWKTDMSTQTQISEGSPFQVLAETVCPNRTYMPFTDIPQ
ncbi:MAG: hypothetical protein IH995_00435 [Proteobacteria bacterium]|nr:hypothetical protein [Pseudomonadota bacterium]